ncbi:uncharacterized protein LOC101770506 [Setaria italica]|uniref:uncharacterized protein LOC101770506 n=1 Tax=Setaria italica TaxID=4555 RepID=UPI000BE6186D|nr:uncharacterized protein LOC101770506 [Setaria italica]
MPPSSSAPAAMPPPSPREHVERIRRERYFIGRGEQNPLAEDMHQAVNYLSQELYSKDVHFLMELVQNAEDNDYPSDVVPSLEFLITSKDITRSGASSTLLIFNNERGFSATNIESICRVGKSTKKGNRHQGYIGEKGIGFKSVFLISSQPHIFSNGYHIKFNEKPCAECNIGYIVPEWVESTPSLSDIESIYGCSKVLPTTTIILPLKSEKVDAVKKQLSSLHPEMLLFLSKIRKLSVREHNSDPKSSTISEIGISTENNFQSRKNMHAESYTLYLSAEETGKVEEDCGYYMWRQNFPVKSENKVDKRADIDEWVITLAFPLGERLSRKKQLFPGVYAFLPTEMVTNFPFIIQADFLLASSREAILFDSPWNKGILECVPTAFMNAFVTLVKSTPDAPAMSLPSMFNFLPVNPSLISVLEPVRSGIKEKVLAEDIVPCESYASQKIFCKASEVARLKPAFWTILHNAREFGVDLKNLSTHGTYILSSHFDKSTYDSVLKFLEVKKVDPEWYAKCIEGSNLVKEVDEQLYLELLYFVTVNWQNYFSGTNMMSIPLLKYVNKNDVLSFLSISKASQGSYRLCIASEMKHMSWLISWNKEFPSARRFFFQPNTQSALEDFSQKRTVKDWLQNQAKVEFVSVYSYGSTVVDSLNDARRPVISFAQFLYHSDKKSHIGASCVQQLCNDMPVIDSYGNAVWDRNSIMVPAKGSKWVGLMGTNPWRKDGYIELSADYKSAGHFAGNYTSEDQLLEFLKKHLQVSDVPLIRPPNTSFPAVRSPLTVDNAFLLLEWIRNRKSKGRLPDQFLASVKEGRWLKTSLEYKPPKESFLSSAKWGSILQNGSSFVDVPMIDQQFYRNRLYTYTDELKLIGVRFEFKEASAYIGSCLLSKAAGNALTRENVYSLLRLIRYLGEEFLSPVQLINSVKDGQWMKSTLGYRCPADCIIHDSEWEVASHISNQSFLDVQFYGKDILQYTPELELLGVIVGFKENYELVVINFKFCSAAITSQATTLILKCIRYVNRCEGFIRKLKDLKWLKTNVGFRAPNEIFLVDPEWECLLKVFDGTPVIDYGFYGSEIRSYKEELKKIGLIMRFEEASKAITQIFKEMVSKSSLTKASVLALLGSYRQLRTHCPLPVELFNCMRSEKWLHTSLGFRSPSEAILFDDTWQPLSPIANLPFIDDGDSFHGLGHDIYGYEDELKELGVTVEAKNGARFAISGLTIPSNPSFLTGELPCPPRPTAPTYPVLPAKPVIPEKATADEMDRLLATHDTDVAKLLADYDDGLASYESQFTAYRTWVDEDARAASILVASIDDRVSADIIELDFAHQMWAFLRTRYEPTGQSTFLAAIRQEQLVRQGDGTVDDFYGQISTIWRQLDTLSPPLSPSTCQSCLGQQQALELRRTYDFLTRLRDEFEPLHAQLLARHPCVSLMEALAAVRNEETRLLTAGLMRYSSVLAVSSSTRPAVPSSESRGGGLKCDWCGKDNHVEAFCYRKKKAQSREGQSRRGGRSSQGPSAPAGSARSSLSASATGGSGSGSPQRSSAGSETQEIIRFCCCFAVFRFGITFHVYSRIVARVSWLVLALVVVILSVFGSLTGFVFLPLRPSV